MADPAVHLGDVIRRSTPVSQVIARTLGLSLSDLAALHHLVGLPSAGPAELGRRLGISSASATVLADRLERAGHIRRRRDPRDRRRVILEVTDAAASRSLAAIQPLIDEIDAIVEDFDTPTRQAIAEYLSRVSTAMDEFTR